MAPQFTIQTREPIPGGRTGARGGRVHKTKHCVCGSCKRCLDNARWERIFQEKFEDRGYYTRPATISFGSSLGEAQQMRSAGVEL